MTSLNALTNLARHKARNDLFDAMVNWDTLPENQTKYKTASDELLDDTQHREIFEPWRLRNQFTTEDALECICGLDPSKWTIGKIKLIIFVMEQKDKTISGF